MTCNNSVVNNIANEGALVQSLNMLANPPSQDVIRHLRTVVDGVQHPSGPTYTAVGDMRHEGRASTAASARIANNNLELSQYQPMSMSEEDMMQQALIASRSFASDARSSISNSFSGSAFTPSDSDVYDTSDDTPMLIVNTRNHVSQQRRENRAAMSVSERKASATVTAALSRPRNAVCVNELNNIAELPTPDRADELIKLAEDLL